jgi:hypothetical protein
VTIATPNWESGRITFSSEAWESLKVITNTMWKDYYVTPWRIEVGYLELVFVDSYHLLYWYVRHHNDPTLTKQPLWRKQANKLVRWLKKVQWPEDTGGSIYGGEQTKEGLKHAFGPRGEIDRRRFAESKRQDKLEAKKGMSGPHKTDTFKNGTTTTSSK